MELSRTGEEDTLELVPGPLIQAAALVDAHGASHTGLVRQKNEDQFVVAELGRAMKVLSTSLPSDPSRESMTSPAWLLVVADGIGGHGGGDVASSVATDSVLRYVFERMPWFLRLAREEELEAELRTALERSQERVVYAAEEKGIQNLNIGTTLTMAYVLWPQMYVAHAGDSRCYLVRNHQISRLTHDHTLAEQLAEANLLASEGIEHQTRSVLVNAVGGGLDSLHAEVTHVHLRPGDAVVLCTDGLTGHVSDEEIVGELSMGHSARASCDALIRLANRRGGGDNVTVVVARF